MTKRIPNEVEDEIFEMKKSWMSNEKISDAILEKHGLFYSRKRIWKCFVGTGYEKA